MSDNIHSILELEEFIMQVEFAGIKLPKNLTLEIRSNSLKEEVRNAGYMGPYVDGLTLLYRNHKIKLENE